MTLLILFLNCLLDPSETGKTERLRLSYEAGCIQATWNQP